MLTNTKPASKYLSDPTEDVKVATEKILLDFLHELRDIAVVQKKAEERARTQRDVDAYEQGRRADDRLPDITMTHPERAAFLPEGDKAATQERETVQDVDIKDTGGSI